MPVPLIVLCALLFLLALLLLLRVRLTVRAGDAVVLELKLLFLRFRLYPKKKRIKPRDYSEKKLARAKKKEAKRVEKSKKKKQKHQKEHKESEPAAKLTLRDKLALVRALCAALIRRTRKHLRLHATKLQIRVATGDPATTALAYGAVSQSVAYLLAALDQVTRLKAAEPHVSVEADFLGERSQIEANVTFSIRVWGLLATAVPLLFTFMNTKRALKNARRKKQQQKISSKKGN